MERIKADDEMDSVDAKHSYFEYLMTKVELLTNEVGLMQQILKQNELVLKSEKSASTDIEDETWNTLKKRYKNAR